MMRIGIVLMAMVSAGLMACTQELQWSAIDGLVATEFPGVEQLSTDSLARLLDVSVGSARPLLLDVRSEAEYGVSHLAGALHVDPDDTVLSFLDTLSTTRPIIAYCSVGVRSSRMVERLTGRGFDRAANLQGSIFKWANEGREVVRDGVPVREVHPYDPFWARMLDESLRSGN